MKMLTRKNNAKTTDIGVESIFFGITSHPTQGTYKMSQTAVHILGLKVPTLLNEIVKEFFLFTG